MSRPETGGITLLLSLSFARVFSVFESLRLTGSVFPTAGESEPAKLFLTSLPAFFSAKPFDPVDFELFTAFTPELDREGPAVAGFGTARLVRGEKKGTTLIGTSTPFGGSGRAAVVLGIRRVELGASDRGSTAGLVSPSVFPEGFSVDVFLAVLGAEDRSFFFLFFSISCESESQDAIQCNFVKSRPTDLFQTGELVFGSRIARLQLQDHLQIYNQQSSTSALFLPATTEATTQSSPLTARFCSSSPNSLRARDLRKRALIFFD